MHVVVASGDPDAVVLVQARHDVEDSRQRVARDGCSVGTLVVAHPATEPWLRRPAALDGNCPLTESVESLVRRCAAGRFHVAGQASPRLVARLVASVRHSPLVSRRVLAALRPDHP